MIFTVHELKRPARHAAELMALAGGLQLFSHTENETRYFITPTGPYGAPPESVDPAHLYTPATLAKMAAVFGRQQADSIVSSLTGSAYEQCV
ncbi:hypothetical protein GCM10010176_107420 [Nonomuraea spiralis]|nr:hypothetical protein GCM10010176_107420 [Nonomuraea spiralis]